MKKTKNNKLKDYKRTKGKKWIDAPIRYKNRTCGSGVTFGGYYVDARAVVKCIVSKDA